MNTNCEGLGMIHYDSSNSDFSFSYEWKDILTEASCIADKIVNLKMKKESKIRSIRKDTLLFINQKK